MAQQFASRMGVSSNLASTTTSTTTAAFGAFTNQVRVATNAVINIRISDGTPTAVATDIMMPANTVEYFIVTPGQKLAALGTGIVNVTEIT